MSESLDQILQKTFGKGISTKEASPKSPEQLDEELFVDLLNTLEQTWERDHKVYEEFGIDMMGFVQYHYHAIENLIIMKYGYYRADVFWWYVLERFTPEGELIGLEDDNGKTHYFETHKQFYKFFKKLKN